MTPKIQSEIIGKRRRLFYAKVDTMGMAAGRVIGVAAGGGALEALHGDALIIATFNDADAPLTVGCLEVFYNPIGKGKPWSVDLALIAACHEADGSCHEVEGSSDQGAKDEALVACCNARDAAITFVE